MSAKLRRPPAAPRPIPPAQLPPRPAVDTARLAAYEPLKAALDRVLGLVLLVLFAPVIAAAAVLVRLTSAGPAFYAQVRVGKGGRPFRIYKLRTMYHDCEKVSGARWSQPGDPRVTRLGAVLRATHVDELPQLVNVLKGEMSLVGPRPERPEFVTLLADEIPQYTERLRVRPGVTGLAQLRLPADSDVESVRRKLIYDLHYIETVGLWLDARLMACTLAKMFGHGLLAVALWLSRVPGAAAVEPGPTAVPVVPSASAA